MATSPKMKWQSRSRHSRWAEQISGLTTSRLSRAARPDHVGGSLDAEGGADEQATFMSKAKPPAPSSCWISTAMAG